MLAEQIFDPAVFGPVADPMTAGCAIKDSGGRQPWAH